MARITLRLTIATFMMTVLLAGAAGAQQRASSPHPVHPPPAQVLSGQVFVGGYFYDPSFGPYPWWPRPAYPHWYAPVFDTRAEVRLRVDPEDAGDAAVYVDGFYAGVVHDFNGVSQGVPLTPGGHRIVLYLEGFRTVAHNIYLSPGATFQVHQTMERLPDGEHSQSPDTAPSVPPPPAGTYRSPVTPPRLSRPTAPVGSGASAFGTLDLYVRPTSAEVAIDGQRWVTSQEGHFVVQLPAGRHRVELINGEEQLTMNLAVEDGKALPITITLPTAAAGRSAGGP